MLRSIYDFFRGRRDRVDGAGADGADDVCVACNSPMVDRLAPGAYRCSSCGHEGGEGWAAHREAQLRAEIAAMPPAARRAAALAHLEEARTLLVSCLGDIASSRGSAVRDAWNVGVDDGRAGEEETMQRLVSAIGVVLEAFGLVRRAQLELGRVPSVSGAAVDAGGDFTESYSLVLDGFAKDVLRIERIDVLGEQARNLLGYVDGELSRLRPARA
jgi:ribosomal protein L37AE/L43A